MSKTNNPSLIISIFVISLLTFLGIEKLCLKSRYTFLEGQLTEIYTNSLLNEQEHKSTISMSKRLVNIIKEKDKRIEILEKGLYNSNPRTKLQRGVK
tara:strand:- start:86 stop:376 length:291 start_codon:yes stop_codon:yes gene_type:complete